MILAAARHRVGSLSGRGQGSYDSCLGGAGHAATAVHWVLGRIGGHLPLAAVAQQATAVIGYLGSTAANETREAAFRRGLAEHGIVEENKIKLEFLWAHGAYDRLPALVADFERRGVNLIFAEGNQAALAVKAARIATPVVFAVGDDPVQLKLVESFNKPPATITGVTFFNVGLIGKRLGLLHELLPKDAMIAILSNPLSPSYRQQIAAVQSSAQALGRKIEHFEARTAEELDRAFAAMIARRVGGLLHATDPFFNSNRRQLVELAMRNRLPSVFSGREYLEFGAAAAYGASIPDAVQQAGRYAGRILKGEKPENLPVVQSARFELILNLKAAKPLGIAFSPTMLALADDVIE